MTNTPIPFAFPRTAADTARVPEPLFPVWAPDGHMEMHTRQNCNDLLRHGTFVDGVLTRWMERDPRQVLAQVERDLARAKKAADGANAIDAQRSATPLPTIPVLGVADADKVQNPKLDKARKELTDLGGVADPTWGLSRLTKEIDTLLAAPAQVVPVNKAD